jgi:hypothetical protein
VSRVSKCMTARRVRWVIFRVPDGWCGWVCIADSGVDSRYRAREETRLRAWRIGRNGGVDRLARPVACRQGVRKPFSPRNQPSSRARVAPSSLQVFRCALRPGSQGCWFPIECDGRGNRFHRIAERLHVRPWDADFCNTSLTGGNARTARRRLSPCPPPTSLLSLW